MNKFYSNIYLITSLRILFAFIFIIAGIEKITDPESFAISISNYKILPIFLINIFAILLPWIEIVAGLLLFFGYSVKENMIILNGLLIIFTIMISIAVLRGLDIDCGCFGTKYGQKVGLLKIFENIFTICAGLLVYKFSDKSKILFKYKISI